MPRCVGLTHCTTMWSSCPSYPLPERDYVTFGSLLSQFRLSSVCLSVTFVCPTQGLKLSAIFLHRRIPWPSSDFRAKFYGDHPRETSPSGALNLATYVTFGYLISWWVSCYTMPTGLTINRPGPGESSKCSGIKSATNKDIAKSTVICQVGGLASFIHSYSFNKKFDMSQTIQ